MPPISHVFVLMLENRSFDHLFGFSQLTGTDAATGQPTSIDGLTGAERNTYAGIEYPVVRGADFSLAVDPSHEFPAVLDQLAGPHVPYVAPYPPLQLAGFVDSFVQSGGGADPGAILKGFDTATQLPILHTLAREFAICDRWFSSMPGPTWPNRMFVHGASSSGLDHSPTTAEILGWETVEGFAFPNGSIFDALRRKGVPFRLYSGDEFPMVAALRGIELLDTHRIEDLVRDLKTPTFLPSYVFIEPAYDIPGHFRHGSSMHPLGDVRAGEALVKTVYEALRASSVWASSVLLVLWDEHGGFYDHVPPPVAVPPGDTAPGSKYDQFGFTFAQYGVRLPALVVSPFVPRGTIDHRLYDHASVPATLEALFGLPAMTARDAQARTVLDLLSLSTPRTSADAAPMTLPSAAALPDAVALAPVSRENDPIDQGLLPSLVHSALCQDLRLDPTSKDAILAVVQQLKTRGDAMRYIASVRAKRA